MESAAGTKHHDAGLLRSIEVHVARAHGGGWNVIVTQDGRILEIRHCDDWHRVERTFLRMSGDHRPHRVAAA